MSSCNESHQPTVSPNSVIATDAVVFEVAVIIRTLGAKPWWPEEDITAATMEAPFCPGKYSCQRPTHSQQGHATAAECHLPPLYYREGRHLYDQYL